MNTDNKITVDEQFRIQYNEVKTFWKKKRRKRTLLFLILTIAGIIMTIICSTTEYFTLIKYPMFFAILACATCTIRELIIPMKEETAELKRLERIYDEERFRERKG